MRLHDRRRGDRTGDRRGAAREPAACVALLARHLARSGRGLERVGSSWRARHSTPARSRAARSRPRATATSVTSRFEASEGRHGHRTTRRSSRRPTSSGVRTSTAAAIPPVRELLGTSTDVDVGYAVQQLNTVRSPPARRCRAARSASPKAVQAQVGVDQPDFGTLYADTEYGDGVDIPSGRLIQPRAEGEVALVIGRAEQRTARLRRDRASRRIRLPAIEVVDSRIENWQISIVDTIGDNASCGVYVVGSRPVPLDGSTSGRCRCR